MLPSAIHPQDTLEVKCGSLQCASVDAIDFLYCVCFRARFVLKIRVFFVECIDSRFSMERKNEILRERDPGCMADPTPTPPHAFVCLSYTLTFVPTLKIVDVIIRNAQTPSKLCSVCANWLEVEFASWQCARVDTGGDFLYGVYASELNLLARHAYFMSNPSIHFLYGTQKNDFCV